MFSARINTTGGKNALTYLIVVCTAIRCVLSVFLNLGNDEVYYFTYAVQPDWNHFDHPPLVGIFIRLFTLNLNWINEFSVRLPAIAGAAVNTWLIAKCGERLGNRQIGLYAAILYNTSIYTSIISGLFILPDSIQVVFWLCAIYCMLLLADSSDAKQKSSVLILLGLFIGLAILCKVHGVFLWFGFIGFVIFERPALLSHPRIYVSIALTAVVISPIVYWNFTNDFASWAFHSKRVELKSAIDLISLLRTTLGQIAYQNPINFVIIILAVVHIAKNRTDCAPSKVKLLLWLSMPMIFATMLVSSFRTTLPHWSGPGFIALNLLGALFLSSDKTRMSQRSKKLLINSSMMLMIVVLISGSLLVKAFPGTLGTISGSQTGSGDATLDLTGWEDLRAKFEKIRIRDIQDGTMPADAPIVTHKWFPGAHIYFYAAYPLNVPVIGVGEVSDLHKFSWLNEVYPAISRGTNAYYITASNYFSDPARLYSDQFKQISLTDRIPHYRNGKIARYWYVYHLKNAVNALPKKSIRLSLRQKH